MASPVRYRWCIDPKTLLTLGHGSYAFSDEVLISLLNHECMVLVMMNREYRSPKGKTSSPDREKAHIGMYDENLYIR